MITAQPGIGPQTEHDCPVCAGCGEEGREEPGWWHGSGVFVQTWPCSHCRGHGTVTCDCPANVEADHGQDDGGAWHSWPCEENA